MIRRNWAHRPRIGGGRTRNEEVLIMKKCLAMILALVMLLTLCVPAFAATTGNHEETILPVSSGSVPVVLLAGDGNGIYDADGNRAPLFGDALSAALKGKDGDPRNNDSNFGSSLVGVLKDFARGVITGDYDAYYDKLQEEVGALTETIRMDENGEPRYGTDISAKDRETNRLRMTTPNRVETYNMESYHFWYDWRKSPLEVADEMDEYIEAVCAMTGHKQVGLVGRCLGANFVLAYLTKYGYKNRIKGVGFDGGMMRGHDVTSEAFSGKFKTDGEAIYRHLIDQDVLFGNGPDRWVADLADVLEYSGVLDGVSATVRATVYEKLVEGVTSALALSTLLTIPSYWSCVSLQDYDDAMLYVFGEEGSEKREKYAGLIEKIEAYHNTVQLKQNKMLKKFVKKGGNIGVVSKYGFQMTPIGESRNLVADEFVSVRNTSMGATTSLVYNTLPDWYVAKREEQGRGKYISPDRKVDAYTCMFRDYTWFTKNVRHSRWSAAENEILYTVTTADRQLTVDDLSCTQFLVLEDGASALVPMTAGNCDTENWKSEPSNDEINPVTRAFRLLRSKLLLVRDLMQSLGAKIEDRVDEAVDETKEKLKLS